MRHDFRRLLGRGIERQGLVGAIDFAERDRGIGAIDGTRRGDQQMPRFDLAGHFQDIERAHEIGIDIGARIFKAVANAGLCREMDDDLGLVGLGDLAQARHVFEQELMAAKRIAAGENRGALALEVHVVIAGHPVDAGHQMAVGAKPSRKMKADEARRAGDQDAHDSVPLRYLLLPAAGGIPCEAGSPPIRMAHLPQRQKRDEVLHVFSFPLPLLPDRRRAFAAQWHRHENPGRRRHIGEHCARLHSADGRRHSARPPGS